MRISCPASLPGGISARSQSKPLDLSSYILPLGDFEYSPKIEVSALTVVVIDSVSTPVWENPTVAEL